MISIEYYINDGSLSPYWPCVVRKTMNGEVVISEEAVASEEAELAGVNLEEFMSSYKAYIQSYLNSLTTYSEESSLDQRDSHLNASQALRYFEFFMQSKWMPEES